MMPYEVYSELVPDDLALAVGHIFSLCKIEHCSVHTLVPVVHWSVPIMTVKKEQTCTKMNPFNTHINIYQNQTTQIRHITVKNIKAIKPKNHASKQPLAAMSIRKIQTANYTIIIGANVEHNYQNNKWPNKFNRRKTLLSKKIKNSTKLALSFTLLVQIY